jgi:hypothetical protein
LRTFKEVGNETILVNWFQPTATFVLESERFTEKKRRRESWQNHDIVDG